MADDTPITGAPIRAPISTTPIAALHAAYECADARYRVHDETTAASALTYAEQNLREEAMTALNRQSEALSIAILHEAVTNPHDAFVMACHSVLKADLVANCNLGKHELADAEALSIAIENLLIFLSSLPGVEIGDRRLSEILKWASKRHDARTATSERAVA